MESDTSSKGRIVGIGGIFFKCKSPQATKEWYAKYFGLKTDQWGAPFVSKKFSKPKEALFLQWSPFSEDSDYFGSKGQSYMINYRVEHIESLINKFKGEGLKVCKEIEEFEYGKFAHVEDLNGTRIELWEPKDEVFENMYEADKLNFE